MKAPLISKLFERIPAAAVIVLFSLTVSAVLFAAAPDDLKRARTVDYRYQVNGLLDGRGLRYESGTFITRYPPLFAYMLYVCRQAAALLSLSVLSVVSTVSALFVALSALMVYRLAALLIPLRLAVIAGFAAGLYPLMQAGVLVPLVSVPYIAVLLLSFRELLRGLQTHKTGCFIRSGLWLAVALYLRPAPFFWLFILSGLLLWRLGIRKAAAASATVLLLISPWLYVLYAHTNSLHPMGTVTPDSLREGLHLHTLPYQQPLDLPRDVRSLSDHYYATYYESVDGFGSYMTIAADLFDRDPTAFCQLFTIKVARAWYGAESQRAWQENAYLIVFILFGLPGIIGLRRFRRLSSDKAVRVFLLIVVLFGLYTYGQTILVQSKARYTMPFIVLCLPFLPYGYYLDRLFRVPPPNS